MPWGERVSGLPLHAGADWRQVPRVKCASSLPLPPPAFTCENPSKAKGFVPVTPPAKSHCEFPGACQRGWVRLEIKRGNKRRLVSQVVPSGARAPLRHLQLQRSLGCALCDPEKLESYWWSGSTTRSFSPGRVTQTSLMYHPKSGPGDSCLAAFYEFWLLLLQLLTCNRAWGMGMFIPRKAAARLLCSLFVYCRTQCQLCNGLTLWCLEEKRAGVKYAPGSPHVCDCFCKSRPIVLQALQWFGDRRSKSGSKTIWSWGFEWEESWGHD